MNKTTNIEDLKTFQAIYTKISGYPLSLEYLQTSEVFVFKKESDIIAGFVLGKNFPLRTFDLFASVAGQKRMNEQFCTTDYCELCCFWILRKYRKDAAVNAKIWLKMAQAIEDQEKPYILFGTNCKGLANMYGYPTCSLLVHQDQVNDKKTYIFLGRRKDFKTGIREIICAKQSNTKRKRNIIDKPELLKVFTLELLNLKRKVLVI